MAHEIDQLAHYHRAAELGDAVQKSAPQSKRFNPDEIRRHLYGMTTVVAAIIIWAAFYFVAGRDVAQLAALLWGK